MEAVDTRRNLLQSKYFLQKNLYWTMPLAYVAILLASYIHYGILFQFSLGLYSLAAVPIVIILGRSKEFLKNWTPFMVLLLSYEALQGIAGYAASSGNVVTLSQLDESIWGFNVNAYVQAALASQTLTYIASFLYSLHFPLVIASALFFWYYDKKVYSAYIYSLLLTSYLSLLTFVAMPTAPPWYSGVATNIVGNTVGPMSGFFNGIAQLSSLIESDKFAAFPSLHGAYALLFGYFMIKAKRKLGLVSVPVTAGILFSTVYLGQHYIIDLLGGALYAGFSIFVVEKLLSRKGQPGIVQNEKVAK
ncbi:MAG: phosphatase PAP2 family protein [Nitrososphaerales archaeon]